MTTAVVELAEATVDLVRARIEDRLRRRVRRIFLSQRRRFPGEQAAADALARFSMPLVEAMPQEDDELTRMLVDLWPDEEERLAVEISRAGIATARLAGNYTLGLIGYADRFTPGPAVRDRILAHGLDAAQGVDTTSLRRIRAILATGIEAGDSPQAIARAIRREFTDWTKSRAEMVARTETAEAWGDVTQLTLERNGWGARVWQTAHDERVDQSGVGGPCIDNEAAGPVAIGEPFPSGHMFPPAHPRCRCAISPAPGFGPAEPGGFTPWTGGDAGGVAAG